MFHAGLKCRPLAVDYEEGKKGMFSLCLQSDVARLSPSGWTKKGCAVRVASLRVRQSISVFLMQRWVKLRSTGHTQPVKTFDPVCSAL